MEPSSCHESTLTHGLAFHVGYCIFFLFRERKTTEHENHDIIKHDAILASSTNRTEEPNLERNFRDDFNTISDEELDFNSMSMDSEGEGKIAELDDKARMLKEKYAKENRLVMEKIENIKKELRESKEKEATFTQEFLEMKMRSDALEEDLGRLDEARRRQEGKETKWRKKMDKKRKKNSRRLEKAQAQRPLDLKEIQAENDLPEGQNDAVQEMGSATGNQNSEECNNDNGTESCLNFDVMVEDIQLNKGQLQTSLEKEVDEGNNALNEIVVFTNQENEKLKGQVIAMKKEKESLQTELETVKLELKRLKASEESRISEEGNKLNEMTGVKARITAGLQDQIEQLKNQNCRMSAKMSKASDNSTQLSECQDKKARIAAEVNCSQVVTELSKASDNRLKDLLEQVENLKKQNQYLQEEASEAKKQLANKMDYIPTEALEDNKYARRALKKKRREIKKLKKRVGRNEREIEVLEKFIRQGGPDNIATRGWLARQIKQREDMEKELENIKQRVHQKENELDQTRRALRILVETTQALRGRIDELENCVEFLCEDSHTLNSDIPSISDDSCPDIFHDEPEMIGAQRQNMNKEERIEAEEVSITEEDTGSKGLSTISEEETGAKESNMNKEEGSGAADVSIITGEDAEINEFPSVSEKEVGVNGRTMNSEKEHGAEEVFIKTEEDTGNKLFFSMTEEEAGAKGPKINKEEEDGGVDVSVVTEEDPGNRGLLTTTDEDVGPKGRTKNNEKEEDDAANELLSSTTQGESGTEGLSIIGYRDAVSKGLPVNSVGDNGPRELTSLNTDGNDRSKGMPMNTNKDDGSQELTVYSDENDKSKDMTAGVKESSIVMESKLEHLDQILKDSTEDIELLTATLRHKREFWTQKKRFGGREHVAWLSKQLGQRNHEIEKQKNVFKAKEQQLEAFAKESMEVVESLDATVKELQEELERTQSSLNLQTTLLANAEERYEGIIRQLQRDLETIQISLKEKTDTLEETEARLQLQTSRSANAETKHGDIVDELQEARLQQRTLLLDNVEERYEFIAKELQGDLETMKISLKAKTDALEETESKLQLQSSLHAYVEERYEGIVKELQGDLENMHISLKLKTDALEETETRLQQQTSLLADVEERYDFIVKELQGELDIVQIALRGKNDALEESESRLQLQSSLHANVEERYEAIVKELQGDLQSMLILLKEKEDTLEKTEARLQQKMSFLANVEERYEFIVKGLQGDLETMKISLKTKTDALEETETRLKLQRSLLASAETKHGDIVKRLEDDLKCAQISLKEKQTALEDAEAKLRLKTSVLSSFQDNDLEELQTENKDDILKAKTMINRLEEELETSKISLKEKAKALEQTQEGLELKTLRLSEIEGDLQRAENAVKEDVVALEKAEFDYQLKSSLVHSLQAKACLRENELEELKLTIKGRDLELERVDGSLNELKKLMEMLYTNNEPKGLQEMVFPVEPTQDEELVGDEKANLLREVLAANAGFKAEKIMADREKSFLREQINSALEELKEKSKQIWDLEMDLKETRMQVSRLESKKQEMEELQGGELLQSHAEFTKQENRVWRSESHRLENEFLLEGIDEMINCDGQNVSSRPLMVRYINFT